MSGNLLGSWNLPAIYLDAWADTNGVAGLAKAVSAQLDPKVVTSIKAFAAQCSRDNGNPCLNGAFDNDADLAAMEFATGGADSTFGYSERLHLIRKKAPNDTFYISSAPLGPGSRPVVFVDALVLRGDCDAGCHLAAQRFAEYLNGPTTKEWILMSRDAGDQATPRYLVPATLSAYRTQALRNDPLFQSIKNQLQDAAPYPQSGLNAVRKQMRDEILKSLQQ
jgi:thiamine pyridinylase